MAMNNPKVIAKLLRAMATGTEHQARRADVVFIAAADLLDPPPSELEPLFYVAGRAIFQRPVRTERGVRMGFVICEVCDGVQPADVCAILNRGEPATE